MNILDEVKTRLSITGSDLDGTIQGMIDDVVAYCRSAGLKYTQLTSTRAVGLIARGVADLWNYGAGNGKFSDIFQLRLNQMTLDAASLDHDVELQVKSVAITENGTTEITPDDGYVLSSVTVDVNVPSKPEQTKSVAITENGTTKVTPDDGYVLSSVDVDVNVPSKPEQTKSVTITENGTTEITPDDGHVLSSVSVSVNVAGGPGIVTIPPVSLPLKSTSENILTKTIDIDLGSIEWAQAKVSDISYLFSQMSSLKNIKWGNLPSILDNSIKGTYIFNGCKEIEIIDLSPLNIQDFISVSDMFNGCTHLQNIVWGNIKVRAQAMYYMFTNCTSIKSIDTSFLDPEYNGTTNINFMFNNCSALETLDLSNLKTTSIINANHIFEYCNKLANVVFEDGCFSNTKLTQLDLSGAPLSHDCAVDIFNKLATRTNSPTIKLSAETKGHLTENEIAIATGKGWVVS